MLAFRFWGASQNHLGPAIAYMGIILQAGPVDSGLVTQNDIYQGDDGEKREYDGSIILGGVFCLIHGFSSLKHDNGDAFSYEPPQVRRADEVPGGKH